MKIYIERNILRYRDEEVYRDSLEDKYIKIYRDEEVYVERNTLRYIRDEVYRDKYIKTDKEVYIEH